MPTTMFFIVLLVCSQTNAQTSAPTASDTTPVFTSGVSNVRIDVQVTEKNQLITGLTKEDFAIFDEGRQQGLIYFGRDSEPLSLLLLLDVSGSTKQYIDQIASTARASLRYLGPADRVSVMVFGRNSRVRLPWTNDMNAVAADIRQVVNDSTVGAGTNINEALLESAKHIDESAGESGRRAVLILTDNLGLNYKSPDAPVVAAMYAADTVVNAIVVGKGKRPDVVSGNTYRNPDFTSPNVFSISEETGGEALQLDKAGQAFARMIERIRTRYSLHYKAPENSPPGFRGVEVMLSPEARQRYPEAVLRFRKGYRVR
ncbi:MAG: VWA domain-containing protein [Bryobacteraceae bacterium]|nr:VWA domain-containing protein [Bryobacteraceae bacterium]